MLRLACTTALLAAVLCSESDHTSRVSHTCSAYRLQATAQPAVVAALAAIGESDSVPDTNLMVWGLLQRTGVHETDALAVGAIKNINELLSLDPVEETPRGRFIDHIVTWSTSPHYDDLLEIVFDLAESKCSLWTSMGTIVAEAMTSGRQTVLRAIKESDCYVRLPGAVLAEALTTDIGAPIYSICAMSARLKTLRAAARLPWLSDAQYKKVHDNIDYVDGEPHVEALPSTIVKGARCAESALEIFAKKVALTESRKRMLEALLDLETALDGTPMAVRAAEIAAQHNNWGMMRMIRDYHITTQPRAAETESMIAHAVAASVSNNFWTLAIRVLAMPEAEGSTLMTHVALHNTSLESPFVIREAPVTLGALLSNWIMMRIMSQGDSMPLTTMTVGELQKMLSGSQETSRETIKCPAIHTLFMAAGMFADQLAETAKALGPISNVPLGGADKILHAITDMAVSNEEILSPDNYIALLTQILETRPGVSQAVDEAREIALRKIVRAGKQQPKPSEKKFTAVRKISEDPKSLVRNNQSSSGGRKWMHRRKSRKISFSDTEDEHNPSLGTSDDDQNADFALEVSLSEGVYPNVPKQRRNAFDTFVDSFDKEIVSSGKPTTEERKILAGKTKFVPKILEITNRQSTFSKVTAKRTAARRTTRSLSIGNSDRIRT